MVQFFLDIFYTVRDRFILSSLNEITLGFHLLRDRRDSVDNQIWDTLYGCMPIMYMVGLILWQRTTAF